MSRKRNLRVKAVHRAEPDLKKLSRALLLLAEAQAEADAQAQHKPDDQPAKEAS